MLDERKLAVLRAIITDYVENSEPVGSKALVERYHLDVSPATIRNDMATLEEEGYLTQPHTSAGRIPTDKGYRLFVDRLATLKPLSPAERRAISTFLSGAADLDDVVTRTVRLLAQVTQQVAIVQYPVVSTAVIRHIDVIRLHPDRALVLLVTSTGRITQTSVELPVETRDDQVEAAAVRIAAGVRNMTSTQAVRALSGMAAEEGADLVLGIVVHALTALLAADPTTRVVVGGVQNVARFGEDFHTAMEPVLEALEEQVVLLRLLGEVRDDLTVRIGHENEHVGLQSTSVVASGYGMPDDAWATLGVVGPTRMNYPSTMASVRAVARYVGRFLAEG
ncbi:MAG: heat-inducible transcriptional repressor HrcA [Actinobacteria bacterium]|nr:heat-inducible transcriptional repressor HrcA [Actinomycetota bacterium]